VCGEEWIGIYLMLKICTVYFGDRYSPDYVGKLYDSIRRNCSIPFQSVCLSDNPNVKADIVLPYYDNTDIKLHWHKLKFFSPHFAFQKPGDDIIVMDIDQVITNNVDELIGHPVKENELITYGIWWHSDEAVEQGLSLDVNGGFYKFKSGSLSYVWEDFILNPEYWQMKFFDDGTVHYPYYGEQNYVNWKIAYHKKAKIIKTPEKWISKYSINDFFLNNLLNKKYCKRFDTDHMLLDEVNPDIKVVHFTGLDNTIHECPLPFIDEHW